MSFKKNTTMTLTLMVFVAIFMCATDAEFGKFARAGNDLQPLEEVASSQSYAALIHAIQSNPGVKDDFRFVVLGDSRDNAAVAKQVYGQAALEKPVFILHTGDVVDKGAVSEYLEYNFPLVRQVAPVPIIPVPGNHDKGPDKDFAGFLSIYGSDRFSFDYGECRIVGVNNSDSDGLSQSDLHFLDQELSKPGASRKFVIMHIPPAFVERSVKTSSTGTEFRGFVHNAEALHELMKRHRVESVFFGHDHGFATCMVDGVHYLISGGAGAELYKDMPWIEAFHHYVVIHVTPEGVWQELVRMDHGQWVRSTLDHRATWEAQGKPLP